MLATAPTKATTTVKEPRLAAFDTASEVDLPDDDGDEAEPLDEAFEEANACVKVMLPHARRLFVGISWTTTEKFITE
jgi:hypothetical protein